MMASIAAIAKLARTTVTDVTRYARATKITPEYTHFRQGIDQELVRVALFDETFILDYLTSKHRNAPYTSVRYLRIKLWAESGLTADEILTVIGDACV
ncbi:MAG: hypothetical protein F6K53_20270 [Moorea sp. SIO4A1]|uniref:hypothetical protein n=1 Tax=Moorena sp. SIO4A1 TaxID=2607835 RepID=UPI00144F2A9A|nr:hypothetical protein [Moorena sp. SIO4A1]NEQ59608.1 hypothetical protein [Moorena sp. SIO4A1]